MFGAPRGPAPVFGAPAGGFGAPRAFGAAAGAAGARVNLNMPLPAWLSEVDAFARHYGLNPPGEAPTTNGAAAGLHIGGFGTTAANAATQHHEGFQRFSKRYCEFRAVLLDFVDNHDFPAVLPIFPDAGGAASQVQQEQTQVLQKLIRVREDLLSELVHAAQPGGSGRISSATMSTHLEKLRQYLVRTTARPNVAGEGWANSHGRGKFDDALREREKIMAQDFSRGPSAASRDAVSAAASASQRGDRRALLGEEQYIVDDIWPSRFIAGFGYDTPTGQPPARSLGAATNMVPPPSKGLFNVQQEHLDRVNMRLKMMKTLKQCVEEDNRDAGRLQEKLKEAHRRHRDLTHRMVRVMKDVVLETSASSPQPMTQGEKHLKAQLLVRASCSSSCRLRGLI